MGTIWVREFTGGLDARRLPETTSGGVLIKCEDGHINRGGEVENRAAFVPEYALPTGTVSIAAGATSVYVFGHGTTPVSPPLPSGVSYQRLQHPDLTTALVRVLSWTLHAGKIYAVGEFADGDIYHYYDGVNVTDWFDGRATAVITVLAGVTTPSLSNLADLKINGVSAIGAPVDWDTDTATTAAAIAAEINSHTSSPDYSAVSIGAVVFIKAATAGSGPNGFTVALTLADGMQITPVLGTMDGGSDGGLTPGTFVRTVGSRVLAVSGPNLHGSGTAEPTHWTTDTLGAFFIDMSRQASGAEALTAIAEYQDRVAVFADRVILLYFIGSDPADNSKAQVLQNTGTGSPKSVTQFGDADVFYLDETGLRSLKARDSSNAAATTDIGVLIDPLIIAKLRSISAADREQVIGLIEPLDGRFWLIMKDVIYVFTFYPGAKVSAWSTYLPSHYVAGVRAFFDVEDACVFQRRVYLRSGNTIFAYGGKTTGTTDDNTPVKAWLPFLDGDKPAVRKQWMGWDAAVRGQWQVSLAYDPQNDDAVDVVGTIYKTTYNAEKHGALGESSHISLRFESAEKPGRKILSSCAIHYMPAPDADAS